MNLCLIRNATLVLEYTGHRLLVDPDFAPRHARESFTGRSRNPMVELPLPAEDILRGVELLIVSHLHRDHFSAVESIPKGLDVLCQPNEETAIAAQGFTNVRPLSHMLLWERIRITPVGGHHGLGEVEDDMGRVMGFVLEAAGEPTVYWAGDTVLCQEVRKALERFRPSVVVVHACGATWPVRGGRELIVMDAAQTLEVCRLLPAATVVATHLDTLDHATVSRADLRRAAQAAGLGDSLRIPKDGETLTLS